LKAVLGWDNGQLFFSSMCEKTYLSNTPCLVTTIITVIITTLAIINQLHYITMSILAQY